MKYEKIYFYGETELGAYVQGAMALVREDAGMSEIVRAIREAGYVRFMLPSMRCFVKIPDAYNKEQ